MSGISRLTPALREAKHMLVFRQAPEEFTKMQSRILTRFTIIPVFLFTCLLTMDVVAKERDLAPLLSPDAWQLISRASAYRQGFTPAKVTSQQLEPRTRSAKIPPVKLANSRVKVKFSDNIKIRLDSNDNPYSLSGQIDTAISALVNSLNVTLVPVHSASLETIAKLTSRAELYSNKQQPDLAGIYWIEGDQTSVDYAAQILYTMDEVDWVIYKPYLVRPTGDDSNTTTDDAAQLLAPKPQTRPAPLTQQKPVYGACWFSADDCDGDLSKKDCEDFGGSFLGVDSICNTKQRANTARQFNVPQSQGWCGAAVTPEVQEYRAQMVADGTWDRYRLRNLNNLRGGTQYVKVTIHIVRNSDGSDGIDENIITQCFTDLNDLMTPSTNLVFCQEGLTMYYDCDEYAGCDIAETIELRAIESVPNTLNIYFVPENTPALGEPGICGISTFPGGGSPQGIVVFNGCTTLAAGGNVTFMHEVGHYFGLYHTHETAGGVECVERTNCSFAGDGFCDTAADPNLGLQGNMGNFCTYTGTMLDQCGSGMPYTPPVTNIMSYAPDPCPTQFTTEQFAAMLSTAENERVSHLRNTPCTTTGFDQTICDPIDPPEPGDGDAICCLYEATFTDGGDIGPGCIDTDEDTCLNYNGVYMTAPEDPDFGPCGEDGEFDPCPVDIGPFFEDYNLCGEYDNYISYFSGDCYIDQTAYPQDNRNPNSLGCLDTPAELINGNFVVRTGAPTGGTNTVFAEQTCCETIMTNVPYCAENNWNAQCASYANAYALSGEGCLRVRDNSPNPNACLSAFGPVQGAIRQPLVITSNTGTLIDVTLVNAGPISNFQLEIVRDPYNDPYLSLYFDGTIQTTLLGDNISNLATWIETTAQSFGVNVVAECCAWAGCCEDTPSPPQNCEDALASCEYPSTYLGSLALTSITSTLELNAVFINSNDLSGRCASPLGLPSITRVRPNPSNGTPNFADIGLLTWMTEETIPVPETQILAYPSAETNLTNPEITQLYQLLPWPMGGALGLGQFNYAPPVKAPIVSGVSWGGEGLNLFPDKSNPGSFGDHNAYRGAYGYAQSFEDRGLGTNGAYGNNVKIAVLDWSAHLQEQTNDAGLDLGGIHEELTHVILEGEATGHDEIELVFDENLTGPLAAYSADHGTAVLGVIGAQWGPNSAPGVDINTRLENNFGVLGLVPDAELYFFPLATVEKPTGRQEDAWLNAIGTLDLGDVICAAYQPVATNDTQPNLNYWSDSNSYLEIAKNLGIVTVIKAGDGGLDLGGIDVPDGEQGAIVATAVSPGTPYKRMADGTRASNYTTTGDYSIVTASGWGMAVTTCGKGTSSRDNYLGYNTLLYDDPTNAHDVHRFAYTNNFGGTAAAAATAAGVAAMLQGFTKQIFEIPMGPEPLRQLIAGGKFQLDKDGQSILLWRDPDTEVNNSVCSDNSLTWDMCDDDNAEWLTGSLVDPRGSFLNAIYNPIFETPNIDEIIVIRGDYMGGNKNSVSAVDTSYFSIFPTWVNAHSLYPVPSGVPFGNVSYRGNGLTTDLYVTGALDGGIPFSNTLELSIDLAPTTPQRLFLRAFMWDFYNNRWRTSTASAILPQGSEEAEFEIDNAAHYIDPTTNEYHLRLVTLGNNSNGGPDAAFPVFYDQIRIRPAPITVPLP